MRAVAILVIVTQLASANPPVPARRSRTKVVAILATAAVTVAGLFAKLRTKPDTLSDRDLIVRTLTHASAIAGQAGFSVDDMSVHAQSLLAAVSTTATFPGAVKLGYAREVNLVISQAKTIQAEMTGMQEECEQLKARVLGEAEISFHEKIQANAALSILNERTQELNDLIARLRGFNSGFAEAAHVSPLPFTIMPIPMVPLIP